MIRLIGLALLSLVLGAAAAPARADAIAKNPRVAELEDELTRDASVFLRGRFPSQPFMISVSIDPLRRVESSAKAKSQDGDESLPYYDDPGADDVQDEWDDPQTPSSELMLRIKKAVVTISLPNSISDSDAAEIKDSIFDYLHLTRARDEVVVERRKWSDQNFGTYAAVSVILGVLLLCLIGGLFFVHRSNARHLAAAIALAKPAQDPNGGAVGLPMGGVPTGSPAGPPGGTGRDHGNVNLTDPLRVRELCRSLVQTIVKSPSFPSFRQMLELDQFGRKDPAQLGALLAELSNGVQKRLFSLSSNNCWLEAFYRPGAIGMEALRVLENLAQAETDERSPERELLLIAIWRLDGQMVEFLRTLSQGQSLAILSEIPKSVSIGIARKALPGAWGSLLDPSFVPPRLKEEEVRAITESALRFKPYNDFSILKKYRNEVDLLEYLKSADVSEEREIYLASPTDSLIHRLRKPFFPLFEQSDEVLKSVVERVSLEDWAVALFNIDRPLRKKVDVYFTDKQQFLFIQRLKQLDAQPPATAAIHAARTAVATALAGVLEQQAARASAAPASDPAPGGQDDAQAA